MSTKHVKAAEAFFRKQEKQVAASDYEERRNAEHEKSTRLRALRLAKEASDREAAALAAATKAATMKAAAKKSVARKSAAKRRKAVATMGAISA